MGRVDGSERHKVKVALKFCKAKLTEHRRYCSHISVLSMCIIYVLMLVLLQVLGHTPYKLSCYLPTRQLAQQIMRQMIVPEDVDEEIYIDNLAIFVSVKSFAFMSGGDKCTFYFRGSLQGCVKTTNQQTTKHLLHGYKQEVFQLQKKCGRREDECFNYTNLGTGREMEVISQVVEVHTENSGDINGQMNDDHGDQEEDDSA